MRQKICPSLDFGSSRLVQALRPLSGPSPAGEGGPSTSLRHLAAFALSRRTIRYSSVEKHAVFGPKMVADDIRPEESGPQGGRTQKESGACVPPWRRLRPSLRHGDFQSRPGKVSSTTTLECSNIGRNTAERLLRSRHWPSPADGWLKALDFTGQGAGPRSNGTIFVAD